MKRSGFAAALCIVLALLLSPFRATDVSELLPVQTLCLRAERGLCRLETESGLVGRGASPAAALRDLERTAPGVVILSTARQLVVEDAARVYFVELLRMDVLRPGTELYRAPASVSASDAGPYLSRHGVAATVGGARAALLEGRDYPLPQLVGSEGRYLIVEA